MPGYDLMVQAISGLMSLTGDPDGPPYRAGISVFDVMAGQPRRDRHPRRAAPPRRDRRRASTSRSTCCPRRCPGWSTTAPRTSRGGVVPYRMGNAHPSVFPYEPLPTADDDLIVAAANDGQFRKLCEVLGIPELADDPRFARNADRTAQPRRAAADPGRAARRPAAPSSGSTCSSTAGVPVRADQHHRRRRSRWPSASGSTRSSRSARATAPCRPPATRSGSPRRRRATGCRHPSWTSTAPRSGRGWRGDGRRSA